MLQGSSLTGQPSSSWLHLSCFEFIFSTFVVSFQFSFFKICFYFPRASGSTANFFQTRSYRTAASAAPTSSVSLHLQSFHIVSPPPSPVLTRPHTTYRLPLRDVLLSGVRKCAMERCPSIDFLTIQYSTLFILCYVRAKDSTDLNELFFLLVMRKLYDAPLCACKIYLQPRAAIQYSAVQ